uniref:Islet amyloid polypeptide n=2 Tax=Tetraodon nigroviridis TaxID=99883 RepID=H3CAN0_TETNG
MHHLRLSALLLILLALLRCVTMAPSHSHQINKRKCNTATCVTQRLADFLVRSSNTIGTVYAPTNVGSATYGKRDLLQPPSAPAQEAPR